MSEFSDRPFVAGSITGLRAFRIDGLGRLTGVVHQDVWMPGTNEAACHATDDSEMRRIMAQMPGFSRSGQQVQTNYYTLSRPAPKPKHEIAGVACQCGFYAYFDGGNDYLTQSTPASPTRGNGGYIYFTTTWGGEEDRVPKVGAIVNGWGLVTVGSRGFRASKAEVVALVSPDSEQARHEVAFAKVRRNYPELTVFSTEREAVRAFPLTDPIGATPADKDFWTRAAR